MGVKSVATIAGLTVAMVAVFQSAALAAGVSIGDNFYSPRTTTVQAGQTVTWTYSTGSSFHTVTANNGAFDSSPGCPANPGSCMNPGDSYSHTFTTLGTFGYHCKVHGLAMSGTIVVVAAATTSPGGGTSPLPNTGGPAFLGIAVIAGIVLVVAGGIALAVARVRRA